jgi:hypothetical protein
MDDPSLLRVLVGASRLPADEHRPTLIVEAENDHIESLRLQLSRAQGSPQIIIKEAVLASAPESQVTWFCYNDTRMNGIIPHERWQTEYPNIQLERQVSLQAKTLDQMLSEWTPAQDSQSRFELSISQGNPIDVLKGAGEWLQRLVRVRLQGPRVKTLWLEACDEWLQQHGFRLDPSAPISWSLEPLAAELIRKQAEIAALRQQHLEKEDLHNKREQDLKAALSHVFPYATYRSKRPDLMKFKDPELVNHFVVYGLHEGVELQFSSTQREMQGIREEMAQQEARLSLLESKSRHTAQHLEMLKELFARLMVNP